MTTRDLVDMVLSGKKEEAEAAFTAIMSDKVSNSLEVKKVDIASQTFNAPAEVNESMSDRQLATAAGADNATRLSLNKMQKTGIDKLSMRDRTNLLRMFPKLFNADKAAAPSTAIRKALKNTGA